MVLVVSGGGGLLKKLFPNFSLSKDNFGQKFARALFDLDIIHDDSCILKTTMVKCRRCYSLNNKIINSNELSPILILLFFFLIDTNDCKKKKILTVMRKRQLFLIFFFSAGCSVSSINGQIMNNYYSLNIIKLSLFFFTVQQRSRTLLNCLRKTPSKSTSCLPGPWSVMDLVILLII